MNEDKLLTYFLTNDLMNDFGFPFCLSIYSRSFLSKFLQSSFSNSVLNLRLYFIFIPANHFSFFSRKKNRWKSYNLYMNEPKTHKKTNKTIQKWRRADEARVKWPVPFCGTVSWYFCYSLFLQISLFFLSLFSELLIVSPSPPPPHHHHNLFSILFFPACNHPFFQFCGIFIIIGEIYPFSIHFCCRLIRTLTMT